MLLALDTSLNHCSVALARNKKTITGQSQPMRRGQAEALIPMIKAVLADAGVQAADLTRIAVTTGPGSFAGVRIGVAAARGLALALSIPATGYTVFEVLAHAAQNKSGKQSVFSAIPARGGQVYTQAFDAKGKPLASAATMPISDALESIAHWEGLLALYGEPGDYDRVDKSPDMRCAFYTDLAHALALYASDARDGKQQKEIPPTPLYMRPPDAKRPEKDGFTRLAE